jgi:serine/threonine protein kinase
MGSYQRFESGFFAKLYEPSPHGMNFTIAFLSREYDIPGGEVRDLLKEWWQKKLLSLKNSGITLEEWDQKHPTADFFCWPQENPHFFVELTSRGEDFAANLQKHPTGDPTFLQPTIKATAEPLPSRVAGRFRLVRKLGAGGMGAVFLAEQIQVGNRPVALKILLRKLLEDPEFLLRFQNEAASTGRIHHPNVVTIYESGQTDDGTPYIAMEYLEGETLRETIQRRGALPLVECAEIIQQVARGLGAAHRLGIIHRDLKPDNIFLTRSEEGELGVKVVDFGIAKLRESATRTVTGTVLGTPQYMSFEQASGMRSEKLDARSDLYSLGIIAYEMLTGRLPFHSDTPLGYLRSHLTEEPPPIRTVNPDIAPSGQIENVVMKALAKERDQRYGSVMEFAQEFAKAAQAIPEAAGADLPTTRRVVPLPTSGPEPASSGKSGGASVESALQTPPPPSQRVGPAAEPSQTRQQAQPIGGPQPASTPPPQFAMVTAQRGRAKYWAVGLVAAAVIAAAGIWYSYRSGPQMPKSPPAVGGEAASVSPEAPAHPNDAKNGNHEVQPAGSLPQSLPAQSSKPAENAVINEVRAVGNVRVIATAFTTYCSTYNYPPASLADLGSTKLINSDLASGQTSGYRFSFYASSCEAHFILARPLIWGSTGSLSVYLDETGAVHTTRENRPATTVDPVLGSSVPSAAEEQGPPSTPSQTPVAQALVNGNFLVQPLRYGTVQFSVPGGATQVKVKGFFRASGGTGNDIQVVIASPMEFQDFINGKQAQVFYATGKVTGGVINVENLQPGDYILAFNNKFSALSRKQVTAVVTLSYVP